MLNLSPPMFKLRPRRRRQIQTRNGRTGSQNKRKGSTSQQDENPLDSQINGYSGPNLPEDIWCYIHSLMPMRDAAKVACVSRAFVGSWRCHPYLHFSKETLGLDEIACQKDGIADFNSRVDSILKKHSGIGLKAFRLDVHSVYDKDPCHLDRLDSLLQVVVKPGIEELDLILTMYGNYNFPCSLLSGGTRGTLRYLSLASCQFHPTVRIGCLTSLTTLNLTYVHIKADELWCLLTSSPSLERFELRYCDSIVCLKIPCLQQLIFMEVVCCSNRLRAIESKAPNLSSVKFVGDLRIPLSLENTNCIKILDTHYYCSLAFYARADLPSVMPNLEALTIRSDGEVDKVPMVPSKFLHLKYLSIAIGGLTFDYLSLVSFLDAAPSLETFILEVIREITKAHVTVFDDPRSAGGSRAPSFQTQACEDHQIRCCQDCSRANMPNPQICNFTGVPDVGHHQWPSWMLYPFFSQAKSPNRITVACMGDRRPLHWVCSAVLRPYRLVLQCWPCMRAVYKVVTRHEYSKAGQGQSTCMRACAARCLLPLPLPAHR